jgi:L-threonylcarbamoyladenylate synthase
VYGVAADPRVPGATERLCAAKGRDIQKPIPFLIVDIRRLKRHRAELCRQGHALACKFWPGPLTLVFTARPGVMPELTGGTGKIGLRVPGNALTRSLLGFIGTALTGTSANRAGGTPPRTADDVVRDIGDRVDLILDCGAADAIRPSTVVDVTKEPMQIIRQGAIDENVLL